jgi:hypothetical protein
MIFCSDAACSAKPWARLIQKMYEVDPLCYPKCNDRLDVNPFIEDPDVINSFLNL